MKLLAFLLVLLATPLAWAVDGDRIPTRDANTDIYRKKSAYLCEKKDTTSATCTEMDLNAVGMNLADWYVIAIDTTTRTNATACTGNVIVRSYDVAGGVGSTPFKPAMQTLTIGSTDFVRVQGPIHRYLDVSLASLATCTVGNLNLDVVIDAYYQKH
jgi:hypothetical protein